MNDDLSPSISTITDSNQAGESISVVKLSVGEKKFILMERSLLCTDFALPNTLLLCKVLECDMKGFQSPAEIAERGQKYNTTQIIQYSANKRLKGCVACDKYAASSTKRRQLTWVHLQINMGFVFRV